MQSIIQEILTLRGGRIMNPFLGKISMLRNGEPLAIDYKNKNRYRIVASEPDGSRTAYYFTSPIYNIRTKKVLDMKFHSQGNAVSATGSNATISISNSIRMENAEGVCVISISGQITHVSENGVSYGNACIYPTTNGVAICSKCSEREPFVFTIEINKPFLEVRANDKYFALMSERFRPFVAVSCIGTSDANGNIVAPAKVSSQKISDRRYTMTISPCASLGESVLIEANLYETKLFQDTTVESKNAETNNAFGSIGFIGNTKEFGDQWLYSRPDYEKMPELNGKKILRAVFHIPKLNSDAVELTASQVSNRFCSFGSTWNNKIAETSSLDNLQMTEHYVNLNLMSVLTDRQGRLSRGEGFILKAKRENEGFSVIATGDNYLTPQILEINYR